MYILQGYEGKIFMSINLQLILFIRTSGLTILELLFQKKSFTYSKKYPFKKKKSFTFDYELYCCITYSRFI